MILFYYIIFYYIIIILGNMVYLQREIVDDNMFKYYKSIFNHLLIFFSFKYSYLIFF